MMVQNQTTGGIAYLYEGYQVGWDATNNSWEATQVTQYNMLTGEPTPEFQSTTTAAGLPIAPLQVNYSEALLASEGGPAINHPFRIAIDTGLSLNAFVWPARDAVTAGSSTSGLPHGPCTRWYYRRRGDEANIVQLRSDIDRAVVTAMYQYGLIVSDLTDGGGIELSGVVDQRWTTSEMNALGSIPDSAFEVLNTIQPAMTFTGPTTGQVGQPVTFTMAYPNSSDSNFSTTLYVEMSTNGGETWSWLPNAGFILDDANRGPFTLGYTPTAPGTYLFKLDDGTLWIAPPEITMTVTASGTPASIVSSAAQPSSLSMTVLTDSDTGSTPDTITSIPAITGRRVKRRQFQSDDHNES